MAKHCETCGKKISWFADQILSATICDQCKYKKQLLFENKDANIQPELEQIKKDVVAEDSISDIDLDRVRKYSKEDLIRFYSSVYRLYEYEGRISEKELILLARIEYGLGLTKDEIQYNTRVLPYLYASQIKEHGTLPIIKLTVTDGTQVILKKDETIHFKNKVILKEVCSTGYTFEGSTQGVSFPIIEGFNYQVGATHGHLVKEDKLMETSRGLFLITNQRLFLNPTGDNKPLSISLDEVLSYNCFANGVQVYQEDRDKGYFISMENSTSVEIAGLCLGHLLGGQR